ncbi:hypothetical protein MMC17_005790 [Xylographa soralifera]|nr:hypothetical protein [Xylographa soralifera]
MAFRSNGSTPDLSWQPHAAAEDGAWSHEAGSNLAGDGPFTEKLCIDSTGYHEPTSRNQLSSIANDYHPKSDCGHFEDNLIKHTKNWVYRPLSVNHDAAHNTGFDACQCPGDNFADAGYVPKNNVTTDTTLWNQYRSSDSSPSTAFASQSPYSCSIPELGTQFMDGSIPDNRHVSDTAPPTAFPGMSGTASVIETTPPTFGQHSVKHSLRVSCLHPGCVRTFGRTADLDRHYKMHVPNAAKFCCYEIGCKFNGRPFYRRDKLLSHQRNMHGK